MTIADAAEIVLKESKRPMHAREIASVIESKGLYAFNAQDKVSVVSNALRGSEKFVKTAPATFDLR